MPKAFGKLLLGAAISALALTPLTARAQSAGSNLVSFGWLYVVPTGSSDPLDVDISSFGAASALYLPPSFTAQGTDLSVSNSSTLGVSASHFFTDHIAATLIGGIPPVLSISGQGNVIPPGPTKSLANLNIGDPTLNPNIKSARAWAPMLLGQYYFRDADAMFRPFAGLGLSYAWFSDVQPSNNFIAAVRNGFGGPLAAASGLSGQTQLAAKASPSWNPVFNIGCTYHYSEHLGLIASLTYMPLETSATLYIKSAGDQMLAQAKSKLSLNPFIPYIGLTYAFR
jgi:outer membrane protein